MMDSWPHPSECNGVRETACYRQIFCHICSVDVNRLEPTSMFVFPLNSACIFQYTLTDTYTNRPAGKDSKGCVFVTLMAFVFAFLKPDVPFSNQLINLCMHSYKMHFGAVFSFSLTPAAFLYLRVVPALLLLGW